MLERLGGAAAPWSWSSFVAEIEGIVLELRGRPRKTAPGSIRIATVEQAEGARAEHVILADLIEGSFPARSAVTPFLALGPGDEPDVASRVTFAREMMRFLGVLGSARSGILLVYPTTDLKGQELLRAGFLDALLSRLTDEAAGRCHLAIPRLHPALIDQPTLAGSARDLRVRAMARASDTGETGELVRLAADPAHRRVLTGTAAALLMQQRRLRGTPFSEYEGLLRDGAAILELDQEFGPAFPFSPSQLETYIACPFLFFSKYVLELESLEERDELDEDPTERGSQLHDILENFESLLRQQTDDQALERVAESEIDRVLNREPAGATELDLGLWEIERERLLRTIRQYVVQRRAYQQEGGLPFAPEHLELDFGGKEGEHPVVELSRGGRTVRLRGRIDRIDVAQTEAGPRFRVIDYKSGSAPSTTEVKQGAMLQLPLYAMAVQRLLFQDGRTGLFDLGYWSLKNDGFKPVSFASWEEDQVTLVNHVLALVDQLRRGVFVVQSRKEGCENYCEFRGVCRVRQVRRNGKRLEQSLPVLSVQTRRRKAGSGSGPTAGPGERA
jgi:RecB family exonuclease